MNGVCINTKLSRAVCATTGITALLFLIIAALLSGTEETYRFATPLETDFLFDSCMHIKLQDVFSPRAFARSGLRRFCLGLLVGF